MNTPAVSRQESRQESRHCVAIGIRHLEPSRVPRKPCLGCGRPIPRRRHGQRLSAAAYQRRLFCRFTCWNVYRTGRPQGLAPRPLIMRALPDERCHVQDAEVILPAPGAGPGIRFARRADVHACPHCRGRSLQADPIGVRCVSCGNLVFTEDGDWRDELVRHRSMTMR